MLYLKSITDMIIKIINIDEIVDQTIKPLYYTQLGERLYPHWDSNHNPHKIIATFESVVVGFNGPSWTKIYLSK